jgi:long-chain acyl-CoA synthetase
MRGESLQRNEFVSKKRLEEISREGVTIRLYKNRPSGIDQALKQTTRMFPQNESVVDGRKRLTYQVLAELVGRVASALIDKFEVKPKERVAFLMGNHHRWPLTFLALARIGAISVPLNNRLKGPEIAYQLKDSQSRILITDQEFMEQIQTVRGELTSLDAIVVNEPTVGNDLISFAELEGYGSRRIAVDIDEEDVACILYTSGTTGFPKGAMLSHRNMIAVAMCLVEMLHYDQTDRMLFFIPLFHVTGLVAMLLPMILVGGANIILPGFNRHEIPEIIERKRITATMGVPATFILIMDSPSFPKYSRASMRSILYGGAPSPPEMHRQLADSMPEDCILVEGYGLTEASSNVTLSPVASDRRVNHRYGTIGVSNYLNDLRIVGNDGNDVALGQVGELWIRGPGVTRGYWNAPKKTAEAITEGWFATGDLMSQDEAGYYVIKGRKKQMINRGGENIYPVEIENVLYAHPNVLEAAVVGVPDPVMGEEVKAVVVPKDEDAFDVEDLRSFLQERLADYKVPRILVTSSQLPRNPGGKVMVKELINM